MQTDPSTWLEQSRRFLRQYLQLEQDLEFPSRTVLRTEHLQEFLYQTLFADGALRYPPPLRFRTRVLKDLVTKIEESIDDWEEHVSGSECIAFCECDGILY